MIKRPPKKNIFFFELKAKTIDSIKIKAPIEQTLKPSIDPNTAVTIGKDQFDISSSIFKKGILVTQHLLSTFLPSIASIIICSCREVKSLN